MSELTVPARFEQSIAFEDAIARSGLTPESVLTLRNAYGPHFAAFLSVEEAALAVPQDAPEVARAVRLKLKHIRTDAEKTRKALKEDSLRRGQAIDGVNRLLLARLSPIEERLDKIERAEEIARQERIAALMAARQELLAPYAAFATPAEVADLGSMDERRFTALLERARAAREAEQERIVAEEAARVAREQEREAERERMRAENERLAAAAAEEHRARDAAEAELRRKEAEERQAQEAARQADAERLAAERAAAAAPDAEKLRAFAATVRSLPVPECDTEAGCAVVDELGALLDRLARWLDGKAAALEHVDA